MPPISIRGARMSFTEVNLFGVYVAPISLMMVAAWVVVIPLRRGRIISVSCGTFGTTALFVFAGLLGCRSRASSRSSRVEVCRCRASNEIGARLQVRAMETMARLTWRPTAHNTKLRIHWLQFLSH